MKKKWVIVVASVVLAVGLAVAGWWRFGAERGAENDVRQEVEACLREWIGRQVELPTDVGYFTTKGDSADSQFPTEEFKILRYVGRDGCSSCKLHLHIYPQVLAELKERTGCPVGFVCIVNPADMNEIRRLLWRDNSAGLTMWVDEADSLNSINIFPEIGDLQTFLLDGENRVLAVGDPAVNPRVMRLFADVLGSDSIRGRGAMALTELVAYAQEKEFGTVGAGDTARCEFRITNAGRGEFVLDRVVTSCDCTTAQLSADTIRPGQSAVLSVVFSEKDPIGEFYRTVSIFGNTRQELMVEITGTVK
ncbi:MAG: DUF1573 domain-containing protein [Muribaculaceae bacterium]|nr:DUF1573 domain-containing protein [Muribaculaceae bacterium]